MSESVPEPPSSFGGSGLAETEALLLEVQAVYAREIGVLRRSEPLDEQQLAEVTARWRKVQADLRALPWADPEQLAALHAAYAEHYKELSGE